MNQKNIILGGLGFLILGMAVFATGAFAYRGDMSKIGPNYSPERHAEMQKAFENNDFAAWKAQMGERGAAQKITEQNFSRFSQMHKLMLEGKTAEANAIRAELGLGQGGGHGKGMMGGQRGQNKGGNFVDANGDGKCDRMQ